MSGHLCFLRKGAKPFFHIAVTDNSWPLCNDVTPGHTPKSVGLKNSYHIYSYY